MRFLTNIPKHEAELWCRVHNAQDPTRILIVGDPAPSITLSSEELIEMGMAGIYETTLTKLLYEACVNAAQAMGEDIKGMSWFGRHYKEK